MKQPVETLSETKMKNVILLSEQKFFGVIVLIFKISTENAENSGV